MQNGFIKLQRTDTTIELMRHPNEFILLSMIAVRVKRTNAFSAHGLKPGEAVIGADDCRNATNLTRQKYRTALKNLEKWQFLTVNSTKRGTIVKLVNSDVYDVNIEDPNQQANHQLTNSQPCPNHQLTTNKNERMKKLKNEREQATPAPENFSISDAMKQYAADRGFTGDIERMTEKFILNHQSKGSRFVDWGSQWKIWVLREIEIQAKDGGADKYEFLDEPPPNPNGNRTLEDILS